MKKLIKRILAGTLAAATMLTVAPVGSVFGETTVEPVVVSFGDAVTVESYTDGGKGTLSITVDADALKSGEISGSVDIPTVLSLLFGEKDKPGSGLFTMEEVLRVFPVVYDGQGFEGEGSSDSILDVAAATAIIGLNYIVTEYIDDLDGLIEKLLEEEEDLKDEIRVGRLLENSTIRSRIVSYFDTPEERELYLTEAGKLWVSEHVTGGSTIAQIFEEHYETIFNSGYLNFAAIVENLMDDMIYAIKNNTVSTNISDYLTTVGTQFVTDNRVAIIQYLLQNDFVTLEDLADHLIINEANVRAILGTKEKDNFANALLKGLFNDTYLVSGKENDLIAALRAEEGLAVLGRSLKLEDLLVALGKSRDAVMEVAVDSTGGLVVAGKGDDLLDLIRSSSPADAADYLELLDADALVAALGIQLSDITGAVASNAAIVKEPATSADVEGAATVADCLPFINIDTLLTELYGADAEAHIVKTILGESSLMIGGKEADLFTTLKDSTKSTADYLDYLDVDAAMTEIGITYPQIIEKLLKTDVIKSGRSADAATLIFNNRSAFDTLLTALMDATSPLVDGTITGLIRDFIEEVLDDETVYAGETQTRSTIFQEYVSGLVEAAPTTYVKDDSIDELFGANLIAYFFGNVDPSTGKLDGKTVGELMDLSKVIGLVTDTELSDHSTLLEKLADGFTTYFTVPGQEYIEGLLGGESGIDISALLDDYTTYVDEAALAAAVLQDEVIIGIVFENPNHFVSFKGMNIILQYWLTNEGVDDKDMTDIIEKLQNGKGDYPIQLENGTESTKFYDGQQVLRDTIFNVFDKFFANVDDLCIGGRDIGDEDPDTGTLLINGTAMIERLINCAIPTAEDLANVGEDGVLKTFNITLRALDDPCNWEENGDGDVLPPVTVDGDIAYIEKDIDVIYRLTGELDSIKRVAEKIAENAQDYIDLRYEYEYTYDLFKDSEEYQTAAPEDKVFLQCRYNKINMVVTKDQITVDIISPAAVAKVYRAILEADYSEELKEKVLRSTYENGGKFLVTAFTADELCEIVDAVDLDALLKDARNDPSVQKIISKLEDYTGKSFDADATVDEIWQAVMHKKTLAQFADAAGRDLEGTANLLDKVQNFAPVNKVLNLIGWKTVSFHDLVLENSNNHLCDLLADLALSQGRSQSLADKICDDTATVKSIIKTSIKTGYSKVTNTILKYIDKAPSHMTQTVISEFYKDGGVFESDVEDASSGTYLSFNENKILIEGVKKALGAAGIEVDDDTARVVNWFIGSLSETRLISARAEQRDLYKATFFKLDGTTELLSAFVPAGTDPAKVYKDSETKTGYVFAGWSTVEPNGTIVKMPSCDTNLYPVYAPDYTIDYNINVSYQSDDGTTVSGSVTPLTYHYEDSVTITVTDVTAGYEVDYIEYKFASDAEYTTGNSFTMPMEDVDVIVHMVATGGGSTTVTFVPTVKLDGAATDAVQVTIGEKEPGEAIEVSLTTGGYKIVSIEYNGVTYTWNESTSKYEDGSHNELVAVADVTDITVNVTAITYTFVPTVKINGAETSDITATVPDCKEGDPISVTIDEDSYEIVSIEYNGVTYTWNESTSKYEDGSHNELVAVADVTDITVNVLGKKMTFQETVKLDGALTTGVDVTIPETRVDEPILPTVPANYEITSIEYNGVTYTWNESTSKYEDGSNNELIAVYQVSDITVNLTVKTTVFNETVKLNGEPTSDISVTVGDTKVGESISVTVTTPGYEISSIEYNGVTYTWNESTSKYEDGSHNELVAVADVTDITVNVTYISYRVIVIYRNTKTGLPADGVGGDLVTLTNKHVGETVTLSTSVELDYVEAQVGKFEFSKVVYELPGGDEIDYTVPFVMPAGNVAVYVDVNPVGYDLSYWFYDVDGASLGSSMGTLTIEGIDRLENILFGSMLKFQVKDLGENYRVKDIYCCYIDAKGEDCCKRFDEIFVMPASDVELKVYIKEAGKGGYGPGTEGEEPGTYTFGGDNIEIAGGDEGSKVTVTTDRESYVPGDTVKVIVSDIPEGYELDYIGVVVDGVETALDGDTFVLPEGGAKIRVHIRPITYEYIVETNGEKIVIKGEGRANEVVTFTITIKSGEKMDLVPNGCTLISAEHLANGDTKLTYAFDLLHNGQTIIYHTVAAEDLMIKITSGIEWTDEKDPANSGKVVFDGWSDPVDGMYRFASYKRDAKGKIEGFNWWIIIIPTAVLAGVSILETILYFYDKSNYHEKGSFWKSVRKIAKKFCDACRKIHKPFEKEDR